MGAVPMPFEKYAEQDLAKAEQDLANAEQELVKAEQELVEAEKAEKAGEETK